MNTEKKPDTKFIRQIDKMLKEHYGKDFQWVQLVAVNYENDVGVVKITIKAK